MFYGCYEQQWLTDFTFKINMIIISFGLFV
ncbi:hypothetical protein Vspart_02756 [Vibrio spartinae]|uniref:Uncharacterized protein n=1 Tax=Vibrio spartinae TaxID=1918945 RepID=A0A1N6M1R1_9VIBR|nr:hypothetical protein Vspart_02756 [Vibrio spartinae]SIO93317.1 hypothetical protein VSP9026_00976 [Vibrio spartinae]